MQSTQKQDSNKQTHSNTNPRKLIVTSPCQPNTIQPMQNLSIGIPLQHDIGDRDLNLPSEQVDPAPHPRNNAQLNFGSEIQRHLGN